MDTNAMAQLTDGERQVLLLLGEGHTAKSIAATLDLSIHTVNDRLREARRKTGAASSRELARLLKTQEIGTEKIGVSSRDDQRSDLTSPDAATVTHRRNHRSLLIMIFVATAAIGALIFSQPGVDQATGSKPRPTLAELKQKQADREQRLASEPVDTAWAPEAEEQLKTALVSVSNFKLDSVHCATSLCEAKGSVDLDKDGQPLPVVGPALMKKMRPAGFSSVSMQVGFKTGATDPQKVTIFAERRPQS